jgi:general secretion pathway protein A
MHNQFYAFSQEPFALTPDPGFIFLTEHHVHLVDSLMEGIKQRKGFMLLTGEKGVGKTTLIHHFLSLLGGGTKAIPLFQTYPTIEDLLQYLLQYLKLPSDGGNKSFMIAQFEEYLTRKAALDETPVIIIDDAQNLGREVLEELRLLAAPDPRKPKFLQEIFVADSGFEKMLNSSDLQQLTQRFAVRCLLRPLSEDESRKYLEYRLSKIGGTLSQVFTAEAVAFIIEKSRGIPRVINMLGYLALSAGYTLSQKKVDTALLEKVFPLIGEEKPEALQLPGKEKAGAPQPGESAWAKFSDRFARSSRIIRISYALLVYSAVIWLILLLLYLQRG